MFVQFEQNQPKSQMLPRRAVNQLELETLDISPCYVRGTVERALLDVERTSFLRGEKLAPHPELFRPTDATLRRTELVVEQSVGCRRNTDEATQKLRARAYWAVRQGIRITVRDDSLSGTAS